MFLEDYGLTFKKFGWHPPTPLEHFSQIPNSMIGYAVLHIEKHGEPYIRIRNSELTCYPGNGKPTIRRKYRGRNYYCYVHNVLKRLCIDKAIELPD